MDALKVERAHGMGLVRCRTRTLAVFVLLMLCAAGWMTGAQPEVLQPDTYNTSQRSALSTATAELELLLDDMLLGSQMRLAERTWTSKEFSSFTAGALDQLGYETAVVSGQWPNERHTWVLVRVVVGNGIAWIPVEATPSPGLLQDSLGHVAWGGAGLYAESYLQYDLVLEQGPNLAPVSVVRSPTVIIGEIATFLALQSRDPDGEIILYVWEVDGDRRPTTTKTWSYDHVFEQDGAHALTLTVVDNRGARTSTVVSLEILSSEESTASPPDCGCAG